MKKQVKRALTDIIFICAGVAAVVVAGEVGQKEGVRRFVSEMRISPPDKWGAVKIEYGKSQYWHSVRYDNTEFIADIATMCENMDTDTDLTIYEMYYYIVGQIHGNERLTTSEYNECMAVADHWLNELKWAY